MTGLRLTYSNVVATAALFIALGGGAYAAISGIPDSSGLFHGCVNKSSGAVRVVKPGRSCRPRKKQHGRVVFAGESAIAWNQRGPTGPRGENGANGVNGTNGATNAVVRTASEAVAGNGEFSKSVFCNSGEHAVGGGVGLTDGGVIFGDHVEASYPSIGGGVPATAGEVASGWTVGIHNSDSSQQSYTAYVVCESP